jgi:hypothetical protein
MWFRVVNGFKGFTDMAIDMRLSHLKDIDRPQFLYNIQDIDALGGC